MFSLLYGIFGIVCWICVKSSLAEVVDGLNRNSAAIQAIATLVLVVITAWYAKLTRDLARTSLGQLEESRAVRRDQTKERSAILQALLSKMNEILLRVPESGIPRKEVVEELLVDYEEYRREMMRGSSVLPNDLRERIDKILSALGSLKEVTRGVSPLGNDQSLFSARLPMLNLKEQCALALEYLSQHPVE